MEAGIQTPMTAKNFRIVRDIEADPFGERSALIERRELQIMGGRFLFESDSPELLQLVDAAYKGLPAHRFSLRPPRFRVKLILAPISRRNSASAQGARRSR